MKADDQAEAVEKTTPEPAKDVQRVVVIGGGGMSRAMGMALAARLIAHCGNRIDITHENDIGLRTDSLSMPIKEFYTAHQHGAVPGKGKRSRKNREERWR